MGGAGPSMPRRRHAEPSGHCPMSAHLMIVAGYLPARSPSHSKALMKFCDSADDRNRLGFPGLDAVRLWTGTRKSQALQIVKDLQDDGLIMQVEAGHRGRRAVFKVFPNPGDEVYSLSAKQGKECPGADKFAGSPGIPSDEEIEARIAAMDGKPVKSEGSDSPDPSKKGPAQRTQSEGSGPADPMDPNGSGPPDPNDGERVRSGSTKGPVKQAKGSGPTDPFGTYLRNCNFEELATALRAVAASDDHKRIATEMAKRIIGGDDHARGGYGGFLGSWAGRTQVRRVPESSKVFNTLVNTFVGPALLEGHDPDAVKRAVWNAALLSRNPIPTRTAWTQQLTLAIGGVIPDDVPAQSRRPGRGPGYDDDATWKRDRPSTDEAEPSPEELAELFGTPGAATGA